MARVNVADLEWRAFRRLCIDDGVAVAEALGRLVRNDLRRRSSNQPRQRNAARPDARTLFDP